MPMGPTQDLGPAIAKWGATEINTIFDKVEWKCEGNIVLRCSRHYTEPPPWILCFLGIRRARSQCPQPGYYLLHCHYIAGRVVTLAGHQEEWLLKR